MIVHLVTDRRRLAAGASWPEAERCLLMQAEQAIAAGVDVVQVRERDVEARDLVRLVSAVVRRAEGSRTRIVVNDRVDVALAAGAHGVHLRSDSIGPSRVKEMVPSGFLVGCSVHDVLEAQRTAGADYVIAGTVWPSASKPGGHTLLGLEGLSAIVQASPCPVLAIGGVTPGRVAELHRAGAAGLAAIGLFLDERRHLACRARPIHDVVRAMRDWFDTPGSGS